MKKSFPLKTFMNKKNPINIFLIILSLLFFSLIFEGCSDDFEPLLYEPVIESEDISDNELNNESPPIVIQEDDSNIAYSELKLSDNVQILEFANDEKFTGTGFNPESSQPESRVSPQYKDTKYIKKQQVEKQKEAKRKRVYAGYAKLIVKDLDQTKDDIQKYTEEIEGYVESIYKNTVSIRIPVAKFDEAFQWILKLGKVEDKSIETQDVTEVYSDLRNRLDIAKNSRARLYLLLTQTADVKERVKILKEIGRLSEEIERMESTFTMLGQLISFSRITIDLAQYLEDANVKRDEIPFPWIKALNPFNATRIKLLARVNLDLGDSFALFKAGDIYSGESSEGVRFRISTASNHPRGDAQFWQKALEYHLNDLYASSEKVNLKTSNDVEVCGVIFTSRETEPYQYFVGVVAERNVIHIIEIFSPKEDRQELDRLFKVIAEGRID